MKIVKCSEFLQRKDIKPFLLGAFYSRTLLSDDSKYFFTVSSYKTSKYVFDDDFDFDNYRLEYLNQINNKSGYKNWFYKKNYKGAIKLPRGDYFFIIENDLKLSIKTFFNHLNSKILSSEWCYEEGLTEQKKDFIRGFMELRGSIDTNRPYITQDYFYNQKKEINKARILIEQFEIPFNVANINFRELQKQFVDGTNKRNTQFRIELNWYAKNIGFINKYKALIFEKRYYSSNSYEKDGVIYFDAVEKNSRDSNVFIDYLNYFSKNVYGQALSEDRINGLREQLGFVEKFTKSTNRNMKIIETFKIISEDKCAICGTTNTFINKNTGRPHFEIHHMISLKNGKSLDVMDNLVKLCSNCHSMMSKGSGLVDDQINAIQKILNENENVYQFCSDYLNMEDIPTLAETIQTMLG